MEVRSLELSAGIRTAVPSPGRFFMLIETSAPLDVEFTKERSPIREKGRDVEAGYKSRPDPSQPPDGLTQSFDGLVFTSATAQTIRYAISDRDGDYARIATDVNIEPAGALSSIADVATSSAAATLVAAASAARLRLSLRNISAVNCRVGDSAITTSRGMQLRPGETITLETSAAVYIIRETTDVTVSVLSEDA